MLQALIGQNYHSNKFGHGIPGNPPVRSKFTQEVFY